jgi:hypothetical protein
LRCSLNLNFNNTTVIHYSLWFIAGKLKSYLVHH